jgi:hypothetical protein
VRALLSPYTSYGEDFRVECPTGSGRTMTLFEVARELVNRLAAIFRRNARGRPMGSLEPPLLPARRPGRAPAWRPPGSLPPWSDA